MELARKRIPPCQLGKHWKLSEETKRKMSLRKLGKPRPDWRGEGNPKWKGGVSKMNKGERQRFMDTLEYRNWRRAVFERDKYACVDCGDNRGGNLEADHIKPYSTHPELRLETSNGRTLCKECHKKITAKFNSERQKK